MTSNKCEQILIGGTKTRVPYLDIAKGITLLLMILGHCEMPSQLSYLSTAIYIFHMPLFFIVCGYLTLPNGKFNIKKKFDKLIVPYLIVFALSIVPYYIIYKDLDILWIFPTMKTRSLFGIAGSFGIGPIWFLPCYFMSNYLVFTLSKKLSYKKILCVSISLFTASFVASKLAHGLPFLIYQTSIGALFIVLGYYCNKKTI